MRRISDPQITPVKQIKKGFTGQAQIYGDEKKCDPQMTPVKQIKKGFTGQAQICADK